MWKRTQMDANGKVRNTLKSTDWGKDYKVMPLDTAKGISFEVEYLRLENYEAWEKAQLVNSPIDPWEVLDHFETDELGQACKELALRELEGCDPVLFMRLEDEREIIATIPGPFKWLTQKILSKELPDYVTRLERQIDEQNEELKRLRKENELLKMTLNFRVS